MADVGAEIDGAVSTARRTRRSFTIDPITIVFASIILVFAFTGSLSI